MTQSRDWHGSASRSHKCDQDSRTTTGQASYLQPHPTVRRPDKDHPSEGPAVACPTLRAGGPRLLGGPGGEGGVVKFRLCGSGVLGPHGTP